MTAMTATRHGGDGPAAVPTRPGATTATPARAGGSLLQSVLVLTAAAAAAAISLSGAVLTDSDQVGTTAVASGSLDLVTSASVLDFGLALAAPGDSGTVQALTVTNDGSLELRWSLTSATSDSALAADLLLDVWLEDAEGDGDASCGASSPGAASDLYSGAYGTTDGLALVGDPAQGAQGGDRVLAAGASELLCFDLALPLTATASGASTEATFTFDSEQTANNG